MVQKEDMSKKYDLIVVTGEPFPYGMAASNRLLCYASSIARSNSVLVLTYDAPYRDGTKEFGTLNGVDYRYMHRYRTAPNNKAVRLIFLIYRYLKILFLLLFYYKCKSVVFLSSKLFYAALVKGIVCLKGIGFYR